MRMSITQFRATYISHLIVLYYVALTPDHSKILQQNDGAYKCNRGVKETYLLNYSIILITVALSPLDTKPKPYILCTFQ